MNTRQLFRQHLAPTSPSPLALHIDKAAGNYLYDVSGKQYLDLIGGISVCNIGHSHPAVLAAIQAQAARYLHVMVYGELVQSPQVEYATMLTAHLPASLDCVYFTNSGAEAAEGAIKLARRVTGRTDIIACHNSYHGHTTGALALMGDEYWRNAFRPLMPGVQHHSYNSPALIDAVHEGVAAVFIETVQGEAGVIAPEAGWLAALRERCTATGTLLVMDEIQCGFGRTGRLWGFEHYGVVPDVLLLGKALGGGLPLGAFISSHRHMQLLASDPVLGHITTFGGHPLCCAAGMAAMQVLLEEQLIAAVPQKEALFRQRLQHPDIKAVRSKGLLLAVVLDSPQRVLAVIHRALSEGLFSDWFLFAPDCIRIAPPLTITPAEIGLACDTLLACIAACR